MCLVSPGVPRHTKCRCVLTYIRTYVAGVGRGRGGCGRGKNVGKGQAAGVGRGQVSHTRTYVHTYAVRSHFGSRVHT